MQRKHKGSTHTPAGDLGRKANNIIDELDSISRIVEDKELDEAGTGPKKTLNDSVIPKSEHLDEAV